MQDKNEKQQSAAEPAPAPEDNATAIIPDPPPEVEDTKLPAPGPDPIETVANFLIEGHRNVHILEFLESQQVTPEAAATILEEALNKFIKSSSMPKAVRLGWCIEAFRHLYQKMVSTGDYSGALRAVQEIAKMADVIPKKGKEKQSKEDAKSEIDDYVETLLSL